MEGQTEQTFIREILAPEMASKNIFIIPALIGKPGHKGGNVNFQRLKFDVSNFLKQRQDVYVSTMLDYFRIDHTWPGISEIDKRIRAGVEISTLDKLTIICETTLSEMIRQLPKLSIENRFIPYVQMHEFEALLFSDNKILAECLCVEQILVENEIGNYSNPEDINGRPEKAPSKILIKLVKKYKKIAMAKTISEAIGILEIRKKCPHFNRWLQDLEQLPPL